MLRLFQIMPMVWTRWLFFQCDKPCTCNYTCTQHFLLLRSSAYRDAGTGVHYGSIAPPALWKGGQRRHRYPYITVS